MRSFRIAAASLAVALTAYACAAPSGTLPASVAPDGTPLGRLDGDVRPVRYALDLTIDPSRPTFSGLVDIDIDRRSAGREIWLHGEGLTVSEASLTLPDGRSIAATYEQRSDSGAGLLTLAEPAPAGPARLHLAYTAPFSGSTFGLFRHERDGRWYAATQFEPDAARNAFPSFDEPGFKVPFDIAVTARSNDAVITNTPETAREELADGWARRTFAPTEPLPTYLIAFAVGPYDVVEGPAIPPTAVRAEPRSLRGVAVAGLGPQLRYALDGTAEFVAALEDYFAIPYPFAKLDIIAMPTSFGGAMENAAAITYDEYLVLLDEDSPLVQRRGHASVHAHELAHMWFGDLVTPAWWDDIWLNEAFASWMADKTAAAVWPEGEFERDLQAEALAAMAEDSLAAARRIREPVLRDAEIMDAFDGITYDKGAGVLAMLEAYVGPDRFRDGVRLFLNRFAGGVATSDDFMQAIAEGSGDPDIVPAFRSFIDQPGVPLLEARLDCRAGGAPRVRVRQSRYAPLGSAIDADESTWRIPACFSYPEGDGRGRTCAFVTRREQTVALDARTCPASLHPNAGGAGYYRFALDEPGWAALAAEAGSLPAAEALALADSLDAAFRTGAASADAYVAGLAGLARHPSWDVASTVAEKLALVTDILDDEQLETVRPALASLFADRYAALESARSDGSEGSGDLLLRTDLAEFLAVDAEDPQVRGAMTAQAAERIGIRGAPDWSAIEPDLRPTVLSVGVQELDARFFELVLADARTTSDPMLRRDALTALARVDDPALVARLQDLLLGDALRGRETINAVERQLARRPTREATWEWVKTNGEMVIAKTPGLFRTQYVSALGEFFCTPELAAEQAAFIESHAAELPGYERSLAQTQEKIALCIALREASADALVAALSAPER